MAVPEAQNSVGLDDLRENGPVILADSLTSRRLPALRLVSRLLKDKDSGLLEDKSLLQSLATSVLKSYNYYQDAASRTAATEVLESLANLDSAYAKASHKFISNVAGKSGNLALTDLVSLLAWTCMLLATDSKAAGSELTALASTHAVLLGSIAGVQRKGTHTKRVLDSALAQSKNTLIKVLLSGEPALVEHLAQKVISDSIDPSAATLYLAVLAEAVHDLQPTHPAYIARLKESPANGKVVDFFSEKVLLAKTAPQSFSIAYFTKWYIGEILSADVFTQKILPNLEKAILRSSEIGFCHLVEPLFSTPTEATDLSTVFASSKLLGHTLSGVKSTKEHVRDKAAEALALIFKNALPHVSLADSGKIVDEVIKAFKGTTNAEAKVLFAKSLGDLRVPEEQNGKLFDALLPLVAKESNENILAALNTVLIGNYVFALRNKQNPSEKVSAQIKTGLASPKLNLRKIWAVSLGDALYRDQEENEAVVSFFESLLPELTKSLQEAVSSPLLTVSNKGIACAYVLAKLKGVEQKWSLRALIASFEHTEEKNVKFGSALIFFAISANVAFDVRIEALESLRALMNKSGEKASDIVIPALQETLKSAEENSQEVAELNLDLKHLAQVLNVLVQQINPDLSIKNLIQIPVKEQWIGVALRASLDPGRVVESHADEVLDHLLNTLSTAPIGGDIFNAAKKAFVTVGFVNPEVTAPKIADILETDLDTATLDEYDATAIKIWKAEEGEVVVDVLNDGKQKPADKNSKDYETRKWEENLKKELAQKKGAKKLTREEQQLVKEQLAKESEIRKNVEARVRIYTRALHIVQELTSGSDVLTSGGTRWYLNAVNGILSVVKHPLAVDIFGDFAIKVFIDGSRLINNRLGVLKEMTGVAVLRVHDVQGIPENYLELSLIELLSKVLFRIKILADDWFDKTSFIYVLPMLTQILVQGRELALKNSKKRTVTSEFEEEDPQEEQLLLTVDIISTLAQCFSDETITRDTILNSLLSLMKIPTKAKLAKECFLTICQHISISLSKADIDLFLSSIITPDVFVKHAILQGIDSEFDLSDDLSYSNELWIATHDNDAAVAELAATIWDDNKFELVDDAVNRLLKFFGHEDAGMRLTVAKATASAVAFLKPKVSDVFDTALELLITLFYETENPPPPPLDKFGLPITNHASQKDAWEDRSTVALALKELAPMFESKESVEKLFFFLVDRETLGDKESLVGQELLEAGVAVLEHHGRTHVESLIPIFEKCLSQKDEGSKKQDRIKESVIILYGTLGRYLDSSDDRLRIIVERLLSTLDTPSEDVQYAVSECIAPLVKSIESKLQDHLDTLFEKLWRGQNLAIRQGAAYGIAGLVKGAGIRSLFSNDVMRNIMSAAEDKKGERMREGVSFALDCLSQSLGARFEPYVIEALPIILKSLGDSSAAVREATDMAARQIMKSSTSYGVKKMIPLTISHMDDIAWRTKKGSVELLGSMAYLDPTQLSASLSTIVPEIVAVLNDSHKEVRKAAEQALKRFGEVIRNPEIQAIVPDLINAIGDPTKYTDSALDKLIKTQFVHYIDGPSLALIIHVIHRGMKDRSASTKKKSCQIVGNMAILVDSKDLLPYLGSLVAELEIAMVDPVPATRSTGARALGSLVEKLGEEQFPDLIPRLVDTLKDQTKTGDRLGSAQALAEVICGLGLAKLDEMLPDILKQASSPYSHVRAGFLPLLLFLPVCFGSQFAPYLSSIIPPILAGLADTDEEIRDTALKAGRLIVKNYANKAIDLLLPELELGLADSSYRIRLSSLELTADLLFQVTGISGKNELTEEQSSVNRNLVEVLGQERRDRILAALFVCRSDVTGVVRAAAIDTWKALVANTPRTVKEIIPSLTQIIVRRCASSDETHRVIAATTLGEVVRRVGANALNQLLPSLEESLVSGDTDAKQGICIALTELINSASEDALQNHQDVFIRIVRASLVDSSPEVRKAAASAFEALQNHLGKVVIDEVLPNLLHLLESKEDSENALLALQDIMETKADIIFPILIPTLLSPPIDVSKVKALSSLASVAGHALYSRLGSIVNTLLQAVIDAKKNGSPEEQEQVKDSFDKILLSIEDDEGVHPIMQQLMSLVKHQDADKRAAICERLGPFFSNTNLDYSIYVPDMVTQFILSLGDKEPEVVAGTFEALSALVKAQDKSMLEKLVKPAHQSLSIAGVRGEELAGLALPRGPSCVLPIFSHGLMYGNAEQREMSALSIAEIISRTPAANLKPFATTITGPLIRVIGERVSADIKSAILTALTNLLEKIPQFLRPFIPQLQRTFVRSLSDVSNDKLRLGAVNALGVLIGFQPRVDPLVTELVQGTKNAEDQGIKTAILKALFQVVVKGGKNMSEASKSSVMALVEEEINTVSDKSAVAYARLLGSLSQILSTEEASNILSSKILNKRHDSEEMKFAVLSINSFLRDSPKHIFETGMVEEIVHFIGECSDNTVPYISDNAVIAMGKLLLLHGEVASPKQAGDEKASSPFELPEASIKKLIFQLCKCALKPESNSPDSRRLSLVVSRTVARFKLQQLVLPHLNEIGPAVFACLRDGIIPIRLAAEKAYLAVFNLIEDAEMKAFNDWFAEASKGPITTVVGTTIQPRSIGDYTKRVASRLATVERERLQDGGDDEALFSDRFEDENEVWAVGGN
ncbi:uncharacterized protein CXQ87_001853 [Candidozyma duobushaemuli]|uniref:TOG domain-containing protein n=1 Tax=Candidozyma duobushaemuli TaxID=1231522 RepID=A0A2V1A7U1_9ASCO|nr:uncharacterized protein CXQ87_001853 [[Candida] duobushaemulonis]PVH13735.1 hypothetical protein CXQ87_001853 [[Candida] duobushaemulonis]